MDTIDMSDMMPSGAYVVGSTTDEGKILTKGKVYGNEGQNAQAILKEMQKRGEPMPVIQAVKPKRGRPAKPNKASDIVPPVVHNDIQQNEDVVLISPLGKIKLNVYKVLDADRAMLLIFQNESVMTFEPNIGDNVMILWNNKEYNTFYTGVIFKGLDGVQRMMLFFKSDE